MIVDGRCCEYLVLVVGRYHGVGMSLRIACLGDGWGMGYLLFGQVLVQKLVLEQQLFGSVV